MYFFILMSKLRELILTKHKNTYTFCQEKKKQAGKLYV